MKLTPLEIKQQTFDKALRGYDPAEVQAFLNLVANEWEHLANRNRELTGQIDQLNEKLKHYERVESALHETLQTARESAEQKLGGAKQESKNIIDKAQLEAEGIIRDAYQERQQIRQTVVRLIDRRNEMIAGIRSYLENAQDALKQFGRDEANLFSIAPVEDEAPARDDSAEPAQQKRQGSEPSAGRLSSEGEASPKKPGPDRGGKANGGLDSSVDDILDEIE